MSLLDPRLRCSIKAGLVLASAAALPFLAAFPAIHMESRRNAEEALGVVNAVVIRQVETIIGAASEVAGRMSAVAGQPCPAAQEYLRLAGALRPYFRAVALIENNTLYCSSASGALHLPLNTVVPQMPELPMGRTLVMVSGTPLVPERPALLVFLGIMPGRGVLASVDGQYLLDLIDAVNWQAHYAVILKAGEGPALSVRDIPGATHRLSAQLGDGPSRQLGSRRYPVEVTTAMSAAALRAHEKAAEWKYLPALAVISALMGYLARRLYLRRLSMAAEIRKGLRRGEFRVRYQPVVRLADGACAGAEALLCWSHPVHGDMRPELFVPAAKESGLGACLTRHLFALVERDLRGLALPAGFRLGANLMADSVERPDLARDIERFLHACGQPALTLVLELTECARTPDAAVAAAATQGLRSMGVAFAIAGFGTGHSSFAYLRACSVDYLKVDQGFVNSIETDAISAPLLELIIALAGRLGTGLVADGVQSAAQVAFLRRKGVVLAQGPLFAPAMEASAFHAWLRHRRDEDSADYAR
jgi:sensor c-di-GMP phosphodiesterase-like protein